MKLKSLFNTDFSLKRVMISLILIPIFVYAGLGLLAFWAADRIIFQPPSARIRDDESILKLTTPRGEKISAKFYRNAQAERTILFSHGNAETIFHGVFFYEKLRETGFNVLVYDYRGYGTSDGKPSEQNAYEDIETAYKYLTDELQIPPERIILHGRSLGGAVAVDLAARKKCGGLIVESSFTTAFRVLTRYPIYPFDKFRNIDKISQIQCPALFIHGQKDEIIPFSHGQRLFETAREPKHSLWLEKAAHNNVFEVGDNTYLQAIQDFADGLPK